jgi:hypothetical protein
VTDENSRAAGVIFIVFVLALTFCVYMGWIIVP